MYMCDVEQWVWVSLVGFYYPCSAHRLLGLELGYRVYPDSLVADESHLEEATTTEYINPWYQGCVCCTILMRSNQAVTVLSAVTNTLALVPHVRKETTAPWYHMISVLYNIYMLMRGACTVGIKGATIVHVHVG